MAAAGDAQRPPTTERRYRDWRPAQPGKHPYAPAHFRAKPDWSPLALAGAVAAAAAAEMAILYPLDVLSVRRQCALDAREFRGVRKGLAGILRGGGVRALYAGFGVAACGLVPQLAMRALVASEAKTRLLPADALGGNTAHWRVVLACAGAVTGAAEGLVVAAVDAQRVPAAAGVAAPDQARWAARVRAGLAASLARQAVCGAALFVAYDALLQHAAVPEFDVNGAKRLACGAAAGALAVALSAPLDAWKTHVHVQAAGAHMQMTFAQRLSAAGPALLWRGAAARVWRVALGTAVFAAVYERLVRLQRTDANQ